MVHKYDEDLEFLSKIDFKDLDDLVFILSHNYKKQEHVEQADREFQIFGSNSNSKGSLYKDILVDICKYLEVNFDKNLSTKMIENSLFIKILEDAIHKMSKEDFEKMINNIKKKSEELFVNTQVVSKQVLLDRFKLFFESEDFNSYILTTMVVNEVLKALLGRGLTVKYAMVTTGSFMQFLTGSIGWVIMIIWTTIDISATYKVTIPTVIYVAYLRQKYSYENKEIYKNESKTII